MHVYDQSGKHILELANSTPTHTYDYEFNLNNLRAGHYSYVAWCNSSQSGGLISSTLTVTMDGEPINSNREWLILLCYFVLMLAFIVIIHSYKEEILAIIIYGIIAGTISALFLSWLYFYSNILSGNIIKYALIALSAAFSLLFWTLAYTLRQSEKSKNED